MKRVTKNNLLRLIKLKKMYMENEEQDLLKEINDFIDNAINRDKHYFSKLYSYGFDKEILRYLL